MNLQNDVSFHLKYKLRSIDPETGERIESGWSENRLFKTVGAGRRVHITGVPPNPTMVLGYSPTGAVDNFENTLGLTPIGYTTKPVVHGWVDPQDMHKGYQFKGGGLQTLLPNTTTRGFKANQVGIDLFSIARVRNEAGDLFNYPVVPNVEIEIEFEMTMVLKPQVFTTMPVVNQIGAPIGSLPVKTNIAIDIDEFNSANYQWFSLASKRTGLISALTVNGSVTDPETLKKITKTDSIWDNVYLTPNGTQGDHILRGMFLNAKDDIKFIRLGIPLGVPGFYLSVIFDTVQTLPKRYLYDIEYTLTHTET